MLVVNGERVTAKVMAKEMIRVALEEGMKIWDIEEYWQKHNQKKWSKGELARVEKSLIKIRVKIDKILKEKKDEQQKNMEI